jgi:hypothetical protein
VSTEHLRDLFNLPEQVVKGDFVVDLHRGIDEPEKTIRTYLPTPRVVQSMGKAMGLMKDALETGKSRAAHVHGTFGSGKSHFLAVLDLLISDVPVAWAREEFHDLRPKNPWIGTKKVLILPVHCTNARCVEDRVFTDYLKLVREKHPGSHPPALFHDQPLFELAEAQRRDMPSFFDKLNKGAAAPAGGFAELLNKARWDEQRFEEAIKSSDPELRKELFDALTATHYTTWAKNPEHFVSFNDGLKGITAHAKELGYELVVLLLDELILWLATLKSDHTILEREVQKVSDLVKEDREPRAIPIVSLIARQKSLKTLLGEDQVGGTWESIDHQLSFWSERFDTINLESRDLPRIIQHRVLKPVSDKAEAAIQSAFDAARKMPRADWAALMGDYEVSAFRELYPFSPALIESLVTMSNVLQRKRSVLRILTDLLVDHVGDLPVGSLVPLGDLFDVIAQEALKDPVIEERLRNARKIYEGTLLDLIRKKHGTNTTEKCQRLRDDHRAVIGCSGCEQRNCRNENRIAKSLLLAGLAPQTKVLKDMTPTKLSRLNHGVIRSPIPGEEAMQILQTVRSWAMDIGLRIDGGGDNPTLRLELFGVDVNPFLDGAAAADNDGARQRILRELLYQELGLEKTERELTKIVGWRGTKRRGEVKFANVRLLQDDDFRPGPDCEWKVVVDFPWDLEGFKPEDDVRVVERFLEDQQCWSIVWLPSFFSPDLRARLGRLARVEDVLRKSDSRQQDPLNDLTPAQREIALENLRSMRDQLRLRIREALGVAYGVRPASDVPGAIDEDYSLEQHTYPLNRNCKPVAFSSLGLSGALDELVDALLSTRYPAHPHFRAPVGRAVCQRVTELYEQLLRASKRLETHKIDKRELADAKAIAAPLELLEVSNDVVIVRDSFMQGLQRKLVASGEERPTVEQLLGLLESEQQRGLEPFARDLAVACYALYTRAAVCDQRGEILDPIPFGKLRLESYVQPYDLPSVEHWQGALELASHWGTKMAGRGLTPVTVTSLRKEVDQRLQGAWKGAADLVARLEDLWGRWGNGEEPHRIVTARSAARLVDALTGLSARQTVEALVNADLRTSPTAVFESLDHIAEVLRTLEARSDQAFANAKQTGQATDLLSELCEVLGADETNRGLAKLWRELGDRADRLVAKVLEAAKPKPADVSKEKKDPKKPTLGSISGSESVSGPEDVERAMAAIKAKLEKALVPGKSAVIHWQLKQGGSA